MLSVYCERHNGTETLVFQRVGTVKALGLIKTMGSEDPLTSFMSVI